MYNEPGQRVHVTNPKGADPIPNNTPCVLGGHVGWVMKNTQIDRWTKPGSVEATSVMPEEGCVLFVTDVHELELSGPLAGVKVEDKLFINPKDNTVLTEKAAGELAGEETALALGIVDYIDNSRNPQVARVNTSDLKPFLTA